MTQKINSRSPRPCKKGKVVAVVFLAVLLLILWAYMATFSVAILSIMHVLTSIVLLAVMGPLAFANCKEMLSCKGERTDSLSTAFYVLFALIMVTLYAISAIKETSVAPSARVLSLIIDFFTMVVLPIALVASRLFEQAVHERWLPDSVLEKISGGYYRQNGASDCEQEAVLRDYDQETVVRDNDMRSNPIRQSTVSCGVGNVRIEYVARCINLEGYGTEAGLVQGRTDRGVVFTPQGFASSDGARY